jgi:hypothetical protein
MKKHLHLSQACFLVVILVFLAACQSDVSFSGFADLPVETDELNTQVYVFAPVGANSFEIGDDIFLVVQATGENTLVFPPGFGAVIYRYNKNQWIQVEKLPAKYAYGDWIIPPGGKASEIIWTKLSDQSHKILLRVFVFGHVYQHGETTDEIVGGYTDIVLHP